MNTIRTPFAKSPPDNHWLFWVAVALVGGVFFFVGHDFQVSLYERFAPWSDADGPLASGGNAMKGAALGLIGLMGLYLLVRRDGRPLGFDGWLPAAMAFYLCWAAASALWSSDPAMTGRKLAVLGFCSLAGLGFVRQFQLRDLAVMALAITGFYLLVGVATELSLGTFQPWEAEYRFAGTVHPNTQGAFLTIFCLAAFNLARDGGRNRAWYWALFAGGLFFLLLTKSRTSCAGLLAALGAMWWLTASGRARLSAVLSAAFVVSALALACTAFDEELDGRLAHLATLGRGEDAETLSGRLPIWSELFTYMGRSPLIGYGYDSFWTARRIEALSEDLQWPLREAHNAFIDCTLGVGLVGAAALLAAALGVLCRAAIVYRTMADAGAGWIFCILIFALVNACQESGMASASFITLMAGGGAAMLAFGKHYECKMAQPTGYNPWAWEKMKHGTT